VSGAAEVVEVHCTAHDYDDPGKPAIAWDDKTARDLLVDGLVGDAHRLLGHLPDQELGPRAAEAVALLALISGQDVEPVEGSDGTDGQWRIARQVASDRVICTVDPESRHVHKSVHHRQDGFKAHIAVEPDTGIITDCALRHANGTADSEATVAADLLEGEDDPVAVLADSAYGSGEFRAHLVERGHRDVVKPAPLSPAVPGGFTVDDFIVDHADARVTCPAGLTRSITAAGNAVFGAACAGCGLRSRCTTAIRGKTLKFRPHDALQRQARRRARNPLWLNEYRRHRPMVERSIAWLTRGNRKVRYRGVTKNDHWLHHRSAALNLRRLLAMGLTHTGTTWALA
jgi:IS5 family transposase